MAFAPIALVLPQWEDFPNYWLKAYDEGTTTPLSMATDATGSTLVAKLELDSQGFINTAGNARLIPFIDGDYDLWLFPTETEADANDTTNAIQFADNLNADPVSSLTAEAIGSLVDDRYVRTFDTVAAMVAATDLSVGDIVSTVEYSVGENGGNTYEIVSAATGTDDGGSFIDLATHQAKGLFKAGVKASQFGIEGNGADEASKVQNLISYGSSSVDFEGLTVRCDTVITLVSDQTLKDGSLDFSSASTSLTCVTATGSFEAAQSLTADSAFGDTVVDISDATGIAKDDLLYISDTQDWASGTPQGEYVMVKSVSGNAVTLSSKTRGNYLTASSAQVEKLVPVENIRLNNFKLIGAGYTGTETQNGLVATNCRNIKISNCEFKGFAQRLIRFVRSWDVSVSQNTFSDSQQGGFGYGVAIADGCHHVQVGSNTFDGMRHAVTIGGSSGVNRYITATNNTGTGMKDAMLDTHAEADYTVFTGNTGSFILDNASDDAVTLQGANAIVSDNVFTGAIRGGVLCQVQVLDGMTEKPPGVSVTGNRFVEGGTGTGIFVDTSASGCTDMANVLVADNICQNFDGVGISINASQNNIEGLTVTGNQCSMADNGIKLDTDSTNTIKGAIINNNYLVMDADTTESIRLIGASAGSIAVVNITGNVIRNGTNGIRLSTADSVMITSNQTLGLSGAVVNTGTATNVTQDNNV